MREWEDLFEDLPSPVPFGWESCWDDFSIDAPLVLNQVTSAFRLGVLLGRGLDQRTARPRTSVTSAFRLGVLLGLPGNPETINRKKVTSAFRLGVLLGPRKY